MFLLSDSWVKVLLPELQERLRGADKLTHDSKSFEEFLTYNTERKTLALLITLPGDMLRKSQSLIEENKRLREESKR